MPNKRPVKQGFSYDCGASQMDHRKSETKSFVRSRRETKSQM